MSKWANIKDQLSDGSVRIRYFGGLAVILIAVVIGYLTLSKRTTIAAGNAASAVANVPDVAAQSPNAPAGQGAQQGSSPVYDKLLAKENADNAQKARASGDSAVPVMRDQPAGEGTEKKQTPNQQQSAQDVAAEQQRKAAEEAAEAQQRQQAAQQRKDQVAAIQAKQQSQISKLITAWEPKPHTNIAVTQPASMGTGQPTLATGGTLPGQPGSANGVASGAATAQVATAGRVVIKAGDPPDYGQLTTGVNTDEGGPVTAKVVSGALAGATLLGKAEVGSNNAQKTGIHFTTASIPGQTNSIAIDAWAIDPDTARTAIASNVDNHYLLRYGSLFASAFLGGYGDALIKGGQSQQLVATNSGAIVQTDPYSSKQLLLAGVGNVGKQLSTNMGNVFNRPATIEVANNIGIGILFMADVTLK